MYEEIFAERLAKLRIARNVSAREMSLDIGQNESYINRIENKLAYPSMQTFFYICEYLKITPEEFFAVDNPEPEQFKVIMEDLKALTHEQRMHIHEIVKELKKGNQK